MKQLIKLSRKTPLFVSFCLLLSTFGMAQNGTATCTECHQDQVKKDYVHGPSATDCMACHESNGQEHPATGNAGFTLKAEGKDLCFSCHTDVSAQLDLKYKHAPVKQGDCVGCHDPHSSDSPKMVADTSPTLCFLCHEDKQKAQTEAAVVHKASFEEGACSSCHTPHSSKLKRLLTKESKELCLDCHNKRIKREDETIIENMAKHLEENEFNHKALKKRCSGCHDPHSGSRQFMLKGNFPENTYVQGIEENFELCFNCHDSDLLNLEKTDMSTMFREGERNLHYVHVNQEKGRKCTLCHDVHAAKNAQLIAKEVKFGSWNMPLNFVATDDGGTCATGCHKERSYSRGTTPTN